MQGWIEINNLFGTSLSFLNGPGEEQKAKYLPGVAAGTQIAAFAISEAEGGSDVAAMTTSAELDGSDYVINGAKAWISNAGLAGHYVLFARTGEAPGSKGISAFVVPRNSPGFQVNPLHGKMGMRGSSTCELVFQDTPVPAENRLGEEGMGFRYAMSILDTSRIIIAAQCVGIGQAALEEAVRYAQQRETFGRPIAQHQAIQFMLADMATDVYACRMATMNAATLKDADLPFNEQGSMSKLMASEMCQRVASQAIQIHGGAGYFKDSPVERIFRDARVTTIYEGTSEIQRTVIARNVLNEYKI